MLKESVNSAPKTAIDGDDDDPQSFSETYWAVTVAPAAKRVQTFSSEQLFVNNFVEFLIFL